MPAEAADAERVLRFNGIFLFAFLVLVTEMGIASLPFSTVGRFSVSYALVYRI